jgi:hypothetical protein
MNTDHKILLHTRVKKVKLLGSSSRTVFSLISRRMVEGSRPFGRHAAHALVNFPIQALAHPAAVIHQ